MQLLSEDARKKSLEIAKKATNIQLAETPEFQEYYINALNFA